MKFRLAQPQFIYELGKRANQEDNIFPEAGKATADDRLFIVCDGMGGHENGEVASQAVCEALADYVKQNVDDDTLFTSEMFEEALEQAYQKLDEKDTGKSMKRMGTTFTFILFHKGGCFMAHMGDSRIYHVRPKDKKILYISRDHSLVFDLFRMGEIKYEEMHTHPKKNIITKAMMPGEEERLNADVVNTTDIQPGDYFYLCSDGMIEKTDESDILGILASDNSDEAKQQRFISATLDNSDNHSAYIIKVEDVIMEGGEETYRNDEKTARSNIINYIPKLNDEEVTKVHTGAFKSDEPEPEKEKKLFPWIKIMVVLIALAVIGLFIVPRYLKDTASNKLKMDKQGNVYTGDGLSDEEEFVYGKEKKDTTKNTTNTNFANKPVKKDNVQKPKVQSGGTATTTPAQATTTTANPTPGTGGEQTSTGNASAETSQGGNADATKPSTGSTGSSEGGQATSTKPATTSTSGGGTGGGQPASGNAGGANTTPQTATPQTGGANTGE